MLSRVDRIELVNLNEVQASQVRLLGYKEPAFLSESSALSGVPLFKNFLDPCDKVLGSLAGRKADDSVGMFCCPLEEAEGSQFS